MHGRPCRHIGDGLWPQPRHTMSWWRSREVAAFARLCVFGGLCLELDMWRFVQQWSFFDVWLSFDCFWRSVHCTNRQKHSKPLVYQSSQVYQDCTNSVPIVKNSENQSKDSQNSKNEGLRLMGQGVKELRHSIGQTITVSYGVQAWSCWHAANGNKTCRRIIHACHF